MQWTSQRARAAMTGHEQRLRGRLCTSAGSCSPEGTGTMCLFGTGRACVHSHVVHAFKMCVKGLRSIASVHQTTIDGWLPFIGCLLDDLCGMMRGT